MYITLTSCICINCGLFHSFNVTFEIRNTRKNLTMDYTNCTGTILDLNYITNIFNGRKY